MLRAKDKEEILKAAREKSLVSYKGNTMRLTADFSSQTLDARSQWNVHTESVLPKPKPKPQSRILYPKNYILKMEAK